jgi:hypothetical protein
MTMTAEQLTADFETLADEKHAPAVFRASERIRQHLVTVTEQRDAARAATLAEVERALQDAANECELLKMRLPYRLGPCEALVLVRAMQAATSR